MTNTDKLLHIHFVFIFMFLLPIPQLFIRALSNQVVLSLFIGSLIRCMFFSTFLVFCSLRFGRKLVQHKDFTHKMPLAIILGLIAGIACYCVRVYLLPFSPGLNMVNQSIFALFVITILLSSVLEELVFRGSIVRVLELSHYPYLSIALLSSLFFALLHLSSSLFQSIFAFFTALLFFGIRIYTKNLLAPLSAHLFYNVLLLVRHVS